MEILLSISLFLNKEGLGNSLMFLNILMLYLFLQLPFFQNVPHMPIKSIFYVWWPQTPGSTVRWFHRLLGGGLSLLLSVSTLFFQSNPITWTNLGKFASKDDHYLSALFLQVAKAPTWLYSVSTPRGGSRKDPLGQLPLQSSQPPPECCSRNHALQTPPLSGRLAFRPVSCALAPQISSSSGPVCLP